jgi:bacteriocin biosynthesis cyclodehydratase domain-containing protein
MVDGFVTQEELVADLAHTGKHPQAWVAQALDRLVETGMCVVDCEHPGDRPLRRHYLTQIAHFGQHMTAPTDCQRRLQQSRVVVIGLEYFGTQLVQYLAAAGIGQIRALGPAGWSRAEAPFIGGGPDMDSDASRHTLLASRTRALGLHTIYEGISVDAGTPLDWVTLLSDCALVVLVLPQRLPTLLRAANHACLARQVPFLPLWMESDGAHIGPLVVPGHTPCWLCCELRQGASLTSADVDAMQHTETVPLPAWEHSAWLIPWVGAVAAITAGEIVTALAQHRQPASYGQTLFLATRDWRLQCTPVLKLPRCPVCSPLRYTPSPGPFALPAQEEANHGA